jgi:hypothetical protein
MPWTKTKTKTKIGMFKRCHKAALTVALTDILQEIEAIKFYFKNKLVTDASNKGDHIG